MHATRHTIAVLLRPPRAKVVDFRTYITVPQAAKILGLSPVRVYRLIHAENALRVIETPLGYLVSLASVATLRRVREHQRSTKQADTMINLVQADEISSAKEAGDDA